MNILNVSYVTTHNPNFNKNGVVRVMLLGISATTVKAVVVKLAFFDDNYEEAAKLVDLKVGNVYEITYETDNGTIYTNSGKIVSIEELSEGVCCAPYVRECVGFHNSVYNSPTCSKDEFMNAPPARKIKITLDTSSDYSGMYESIMLSMIRDCNLITEGSEDTENNETNDYCYSCIYKTENCDPNSCGHYIASDSGKCCCCNKTYSYENHNVSITGDKVTITDKDGNATESTMDAILRNYLGLQ